MANRKHNSNNKISTKRSTCFVITPFGDWNDTYYSEIYKPAISKAGLEATRSDDLYRPSQIVQDIWSYTKSAKVLLADLTGKNPNVFYELGLAHALKKPVVLITCSIDDVPFDLRSLRCIQYDKNEPNWSKTLQKSITSAIEEVLHNPSESILQTFVESDKKNGPKTINASHKNQIAILQNRVELLMRQNIDINHNRHPLGPEEAEMLIQRYMLQGIPTRVIIERMRNLHIPEPWVIRTMDRVKKRTSITRDPRNK